MITSSGGRVTHKFSSSAFLIKRLGLLKSAADCTTKSRNMSELNELMDPSDDPIERCSMLCSEVLFELRRDVFVVGSDDTDGSEEKPLKTTVFRKFSRYKLMDRKEILLFELLSWSSHLFL